MLESCLMLQDVERMCLRPVPRTSVFLVLLSIRNILKDLNASHRNLENLDSKHRLEIGPNAPDCAGSVQSVQVVPHL